MDFKNGFQTIKRHQKSDKAIYEEMGFVEDEKEAYGLCLGNGTEGRIPSQSHGLCQDAGTDWDSREPG